MQGGVAHMLFCRLTRHQAGAVSPTPAHLRSVAHSAAWQPNQGADAVTAFGS